MFHLGLAITYTLIVLIFFAQMIYKPSRALLIYMLLISISPSVQYLIYPVYGVYFNDTNFRKLSIELFQVFLLAILYFIGITKRASIKKQIGLLVNFKKLMYAWAFLNFISVLFAIDFQKSFIFYILSVVAPIVLFNLIIETDILSINTDRLNSFLSKTFVVWTGLGLVSVLYYLIKAGLQYNPLGMRNAGGMYLGNGGMCQMSLFVPLLFLSAKLSPSTALYRKIFAIGVILGLLVSISRTAIAFYILFFVISRSKSIKDFVYLLFAVGAIVLATSTVMSYVADVDIIQIFQDRFFGKTVAEGPSDFDTGAGNSQFIAKTSNDERFSIWQDTIQEGFTDLKVFFVGVGLGGFKEGSIKYEYSNAHNIFVNMFFERGFFNVILFIGMLIFMIKMMNWVVRNAGKNESASFFGKTLRYGLFLFLSTAFFANDLFHADGFQSGNQAMHLFLLFGIIAKLYIRRQYELGVEEQQRKSVSAPR